MRILVIAALMSASAAVAFGQSVKERGDRALDTYQWKPGTALAATGEPQLPTEPPTGSADVYDLKQKSVAKAFIYSLVIPGAGQIYNGSKLKGFIFLGIEAAGWVTYAAYTSSGGTKTDDFEAYARTHWSEPPYWDSLKVFHGVDKWHDDDVFPHYLPWKINENGDTVADLNQHYYENIGKYDQFVWGWDDLQQISTINPSQPETAFRSSNRYTYEDMRHAANQEYDRARGAAFVIIANHLVAAVEAAFSAKSHNQAVQHAAAWDFKFNLVTMEDTPTPWVRAAYRF
jgi:hypothetical protein